ncbi:hypothetical protein DFH06DRAFT_1437506 [Mycena polygramma]|nr:hypothetical protein DFH06DRAFT_1437506 [Mycena polygramma]
MTEIPFWPRPSFRWRARLFGHCVPSLHILFFPRAPRRRWDRYSVQLSRRHTLLPIRILAGAAAWSNSTSITRQWPRKWAPFTASVLRKIAPAVHNRLRFRGALLLHNIVPLLAFWLFGASPALAIAAPDPPARHALARRLLGRVWPETWPQCAHGSAQLYAPLRDAVGSQFALRWDICPAALPPRAGPRIPANPCVWYTQARLYALAWACASSARSIGFIARCIDLLVLGSAFGCWYTSFVLWLYVIARGAAAPIRPAAVSRRLLAAAWQCRPTTLRRPHA